MADKVRRILIVDDSAAVRNAVALMLRGRPYECIEAADGVEALAKMNEQQVDLVISDLHMPNMNGFALLKEIRSAAALRFTPVLVLTTDRVDENRNELRKVGATGVLSKPIEPSELADAVERALAGLG